jgi:hypothetical protein
MKFPDSWTGSDSEAAVTPPRRHWRASAARWVLLAVAVTGGLIWASHVLPSDMSSILHRHQQFHDVAAPHDYAPTAAIGDGDDELKDTDFDGGNVSQASWPVSSSWQFIGYGRSQCPLDPPDFPIFWEGDKTTKCRNVKSDDVFLYYKFLSTVSKDNKEVDFRLCLWDRADCNNSPKEIRNEVLCSDSVKVRSWAVLEYGGRLGHSCKSFYSA